MVKAGAEETDPHDARWLAHWLRHGMIRPSFIPPRAQRELRDLTRRRKRMVRAAAEERNRVQKVLVARTCNSSPSPLISLPGPGSRPATTKAPENEDVRPLCAATLT